MPRSAACLALLGVVALGACTGSRPQFPPEARACMPAKAAQRAADDNERLRQLTARADAFETCMQAQGYRLDEEGVEREVRRFEQIRNADQYGVDPRMAVDIRRQELRVSPAYWQRGGARAQP